jgi:hypothetical protein
MRTSFIRLVSFIGLALVLYFLARAVNLLEVSHTELEALKKSVRELSANLQSANSRPSSGDIAELLKNTEQLRTDKEALKESIQKLNADLQSANSRTPRPPNGDLVPVSELLKNAEQLRTDKRLREAEIIMTRAVQTDRDNVVAWRSLAAVQREMAIESVAAGNLLSAAQEADRAKTSVNGVIGISVDPSTPKMETKIVVDEESATAEVSSKVREAIDKACVTHIANANQSATDAFHSSWNVAAVGLRPVKNDRGIVIAGLKHLKNVFELGPWASENTRMSANDAYSKLKKLVNLEEWNDLLARAGYDPSSRDTLKKWGLE